MTRNIAEEIKRLKEEKNAVILAHYYVRPEVQEIADYIGDSFYLSKLAVGLEAQTIVMCGVSFMGESVKILNPEKTVLLPDASADCAMAHMASVETIEQMRKTWDDLAVVCYINSTAELKRHSLFRTEIWPALWQSRRRRSISYLTRASARFTRS